MHSQLFQLHGLGQSYAKQTVQQCVLSISLSCSPVIFPGLLKEDFHSLYGGMSVIDSIPPIPIDPYIYIYIFTDSTSRSAKTFPRKLLQVPLIPCIKICVPAIGKYPLVNSTKVYSSSTVPYSVSTLVRKEEITSGAFKLTQLKYFTLCSRFIYSSTLLILCNKLFFVLLLQTKI